MANCRDEKERERTEALIRPILRGRDIKRYGYEWAGLYLIATFPSRHYDIEEYPAVKNYLLSFGMERLEQSGKEYIVDGQKVKARKKTNNKWFETQDSISYWEDFSKPKIFYPDICQSLYFVYNDELIFCNNTTYFISSKNENIKYLQKILNHKIYDWYYRTLSVQLGLSAVRMFSIYVLKLPIPKKLINNDLYITLKLNSEEIHFIESLYPL